MPNEDWKLGSDLGRIVGLGLAALIAGWFYDLGPCDDAVQAHGDPIACLFDAPGDFGCD